VTRGWHRQDAGGRPADNGVRGTIPASVYAAGNQVRPCRAKPHPVECAGVQGQQATDTEGVGGVGLAGKPFNPRPS
jgi:hypothetical protein